MRRSGIVHILTVLGLVLAISAVSPQTTAFAACTQESEQVKFTYRSGTSTGVMGSIYVYDQYNDPTCGLARAQTVFMRLSPDYLSFVEVGTRQYVDDPARFRLFFEYRDYPADIIVYEGLGRYNENAYMSVVVAPWMPGSYIWKGEYNPGPTQGSWSSVSNSPVMIANSGLAESEVARFGGSAAKTFHANLKYRPSTGGWFDWTSLGCDPNQNTIPTWDAIKLSNISWRTDPGNPAPGDC